MYKSTNECLEMLEEIERGEWKLNAGEQDFVENLRDWVDAGKKLTPKQREALDRIYNGE